MINSQVSAGLKWCEGTCSVMYPVGGAVTPLTSSIAFMTEVSWLNKAQPVKESNFIVFLNGLFRIYY